MGDKIKKIVRKHLLEYHGYNLEIDKLSKDISEEILPKIKENKFPFYHDYNKGEPILLISDIRIVCSLTTNEYGGYINLNDIRFLMSGYDMIINLRVDENITKEKLISILSHELQHFQNKTVNDKKKNKSQVFLRIKNLLSHHENKEINKFVHCFYLSLDEEINARVQQLYSELNVLDNPDNQTLYKVFKNSTPYLDSQFLINYDINHLNSLTEDERTKLLNLTNNTYFNLNQSKNFKDFDSFKEYFNKRFNRKGGKLMRKLSKVLSDFVNESEITTLLEIYGENIKHNDFYINFEELRNNYKKNGKL